MNRNLVVWLILAVALLAGCKSPEKLQISAEKPADWTEISSEAYSLRHPKDLMVDRSRLMGTDFLIFLVKPAPNQFTPNINLLIQDLKGQRVSLDQYTEVSLKQLETLMPNHRILENTRLKGVKGEYQKLVYAGDQLGYPLKFEQFYTISGGKAYVVTLTCLESLFDRCQGTGEGIMKTFELR